MIPQRSSLPTTISGHQEDLRRLELAVGSGHMTFDDGLLAAGWSGVLRSAALKGSAAVTARVYLDLWVTRLSGGLTIGTLDSSAWPPSTRLAWAADLGGNMVQLAISSTGVVTASVYNGFTIVAFGASYVL